MIAGHIFWLLHQLRLVYVRNPSLQLLRMFRKELELGAITFRMLPRVVITDLSWRGNNKIKKIYILNMSTDIHIR